MRVLICGVVGAVAAAAVWLGLEHFLQKDIGWLALAVGLVTGLSVHKAGGSAVNGSYARGGLAALLALAAIVGGRQVYAKVMEAVNDNAAPAVVVAAAEGQADDDAADTATTESAESNVEPPPIEQIGIGKAGRQKVSLKKRSSQMEMVWMCAAGLVAYIIGKGRDPIPVAAEQTAEQTSEQPQDDSGQ